MAKLKFKKAKKSPVRVGFMGCGGHSARHADVMHAMPENYKIVGALDVQKDTAEHFLSGYNPEALATSDMSEFLANKDMDAVLIGTPHKYHLEMTKAAILAGKHVFCEKPLWEGQLQEEGARVIALAKERGLVLSSCHLRRYEEEYTFVRCNMGDYVEKFGRPVEVHFQFFYHHPPAGWKMEDSLLLDHMNHEIDLVHFLFGHSPTKLWRLSHSFDEYRVAGKTESGLAIWFSGYRRLSSRIFRNELKIVFETGRVEVESVLNSGTGIVSSNISELSFELNRKTVIQIPAHSYSNSLVGVMKNFAETIRGKDFCYLSTEDLFVNTTICNDLVANEHGSIG
jgi:predicted dehydrogenase